MLLVFKINLTLPFERGSFYILLRDSDMQKSFIFMIYRMVPTKNVSIGQLYFIRLFLR